MTERQPGDLGRSSSSGGRSASPSVSVLGRLVQAYAATVRAGHSGGHFYLGTSRENAGTPWQEPDPARDYVHPDASKPPDKR